MKSTYSTRKDEIRRNGTESLIISVNDTYDQVFTVGQAEIVGDYAESFGILGDML